MLDRTYDVVVVGAGPAGICAGVEAARSGAKTALIERYGCIGGNLGGRGDVDIGHDKRVAIVNYAHFGIVDYLGFGLFLR